MKLYKLTKQDLENLNKSNNIEDIINTESKKLRTELYEGENEEEISLSSFRHGKLVFLYNNWKNAWKQSIYISIIPLLMIRVFYDTSINGIISCLAMLLTAIGLIICGLRGRKIKNQIKRNFEELELDVDEL